MKVHRVNNGIKKARLDDLVELEPARGQPQPIFMPKWVLDILVIGIAHGKAIHVSGPTGTGKTELIKAISADDNFRPLAESLDIDPKPVICFPVSVVNYEAPAEVRQSHQLEDFRTVTRPSELLNHIQAASEALPDAYPFIFLRELGRVQFSSVQGALLDLITEGELFLSKQDTLNGQGIAWVTDSNYAAAEEGTYTLVDLDHALNRRFVIQLFIDYLDPDAEICVLERLIPPPLEERDIENIRRVVALGRLIRQKRKEGELLSLPAPSIALYKVFLELSRKLPDYGPHRLAEVTLLGNVHAEDRVSAMSLASEVFGANGNDATDPLEGDVI